MTSIFDRMVAAAIALAAAVAMTACVDTATRTCADGLRCPSDKLCVEDLDSLARCEPADRVMACADKLEAEPCKHGSDGSPTHRCRAGVCTLMECGNGYIDPGEVCDDGNEIDGDGCNKDCGNRCGDGYRDPGEVCDDGNNEDGDGCSSNCRRRCGDGVVQVEDGEVCDPKQPLGGACMDYGFDMGTLTCAPNCEQESTSACIDFDWQPMARVPPDWQLLRVWVFSPESAFAVGTEGEPIEPPYVDLCWDCGRVFRYDGTGWQVSMENVPPLVDLWASSPEDVYAVGVLGNIWHFDGDTWTRMRGVDTSYHLGAVWGTGPEELFAVGTHWKPSPVLDPSAARFAILRYDGRTWEPMDLSQVPVVPESMLHGVWASGPGDVFAVGSRRTILHYDGNPEGRWLPVDVAQVPGETPANLYSLRLMDIWGTRADNVVAVGSQGMILRYDGTQWSFMQSPEEHLLTGIWGDAQDQLFATGANGTLLHHDPLAGEDWVALSADPSADLLHVHGSSAESVLAVGTHGTVLRKGGDAWTAMDLQGNQDKLRRIWGSGPDCIYAVTGGDDGRGDIWHYDGNPDLRWDLMATDTRILSSVHGTGCGTDLFAVGFGGTILRYVDGSWTGMPSLTGSGANDVWVGGPDAVFAVGGDGTILRYDGNAEGRWERMESGVDISLYSVWGTSAGNVFVSTSEGTILHYDGNAQGRWTRMSSGTSWPLNDLWGSGPNDVFAVGEIGAIVHYDGKEWTHMNSTDPTGYLKAVWGSGPDDVFAGSASGELFHYDGTYWSPMRSPTEHKITSIWGTPGGEQILVSDNSGGIFRLARPGRRE